MKAILKLALLLGTAVAVMNTVALAGPDPGNWPAGFPTVVKSKMEAEACCLPKEKVALACKDCKNVEVAKDQKGVAAWFKKDSTHGCAGCGGKITVHQQPGGKGATYAT
jgi:hypothetical protein